jgi:hypothetical protein
MQLNKYIKTDTLLVIQLFDVIIFDGATAKLHDLVHALGILEERKGPSCNPLLNISHLLYHSIYFKKSIVTFLGSPLIPPIFFHYTIIKL